jgi:hypothetical protein
MSATLRAIAGEKERRAVKVARKVAQRQQRERAEQRRFVAWAATGLILGVVLQHTENEDTAGAGIENGHARHKAQLLDGVVPGWPDMGLYWMSQGRFIEMKAPDQADEPNGGLSENQLRVHSRLRAAGCVVETAYSAEEAKDIVRGWGWAREGA